MDKAADTVRYWERDFGMRDHQEIKFNNHAMKEDAIKFMNLKESSHALS
jgi:hypothetical protein